MSSPRPPLDKGTKQPTLPDAIARFGKSAKSKLSNPSAVGEPEDQLRAPFEQLLADLAAVCSTSGRTPPRRSPIGSARCWPT